MERATSRARERRGSLLIPGAALGRRERAALHLLRPGSEEIAGRGEEMYFTIGDALDLDLDADLVVLSACQTARGRPQSGEGIQSLARAFLYAGSRGVVASLWSVDDRAAAETMAALYSAILEGRAPPARALRAAKLALRRARGGAGEGMSHPFHWAPFIWIGLPR